MSEKVLSVSYLTIGEDGNHREINDSEISECFKIGKPVFQTRTIMSESGEIEDRITERIFGFPIKDAKKSRLTST